METENPTPSEEQPHSLVQANHRLKTDIAWKYINEGQDETGKKLLVCTFCQKMFRGGGVNRMKQHLAGVKGNVASCVKVPMGVKVLMQEILEDKFRKTKEKPRGLLVQNLDVSEEVEVKPVNPQITHAKVGKRKALSNVQSNFKRDGDEDEALPAGIRVSKFDYSVENYFKLMDTLAMLSGESEPEHEQTEIQRFSSSVTFLSKWRDFSYESRAIRFASEKETSQEKDFTSRIKLPQFSSAAVPKDISLEDGRSSSSSSKDFVMYVGGPVWALDWCPRVHQSSAYDTNVEFIAVSAHPPESSYHKIGAPLTGRGLIQIWFVLTSGQSQQGKIPSVKVKPAKSSTNPTKSDKPRGRPRKYPRKEMDGGDQIMQDSSLQSPENRNVVPVKVNTLNACQSRQAEIPSVKTGKSSTALTKSGRPRGRPRKTPRNEMDSGDQLMQDSSLQSRENRNDLPDKVNTLNACQSQQVEIPLAKTSKSSTAPTKSCRPRGGPRKTPRNEMDGGDQLMHDVKVQPPESENKLLQVLPKKDFDRQFESHKQQKPKGKSRKKAVIESSNEFDTNSNKNMQLLTEFSDNSPRTSPEPLGVAFPDKSTELLALDKFTGKNLNVYSRKTKDYIKVNSVKSMWLTSNPKVEKCEVRRKSQVKGADSSIGLQNCERHLDQDVFPRLLPGPTQNCEGRIDKDDLLPRLLTGSAPNCEGPVDQDEVLPRLGMSPAQNCEGLVGQDDGFPSLVMGPPQTCKSGIDHDVLPRLVMGPAQNFESRLDQEDVSPRLATGPTQISETPVDQDDVLPSSVTSLAQNCESPLGEDNVLPGLVMGLAHNGKVAWDVKWRPADSSPISKHIMGYLAVLLGNGALEVWEVPLPHVTKAIFSSCQKEGNDPRFIKLKPVFLCSMLKCGDRQSIPITLEWSASAPHDLILAGCHDGVVALWKFSASYSSKDTRPLLCFNADTVLIRSLKWAPLASDPESANIVATASDKGLKFWDIRDPFHPLWDIPYQKIINSLDWLPDPSCVVLSFDDGEIKIIGLLRAACDTPVTGMPADKKPQHGCCSYYCSSSSIWSVQVSKSTGIVAYCCSDGKVIKFQLTSKAVEKDPNRNRQPHYLCGSLSEEEDSSLTVLSPLPNIPIPMKKSSTEWADTPKTSRGVKSRSNQEKRAKGEIPKYQTPPKHSSGGGMTITPKDNNDTPRETEAQANLALACIDNNNNIEEEKVKEEETQKLPPKIVAMHRVRWNMNKGSERLVCYGGAAGIVRCQVID